MPTPPAALATNDFYPLGEAEMCIGVPMKVVRANDLSAICDRDGKQEDIDTSLVGQVQAGDWLLVFLKVARKRLDETEAALVSEALRGLEAAMAGENVAGFFSDLETREPSLPPHLERARRSGASVA